MTFEEFLAWAPENALAEWVDGKVLILPPASADHQRLLGFLLSLVAMFVEVRELGEILMAPFLMRLGFRPSGREPDLLYVANEHLNRIQPLFLDGPADLVVEVLSDESDARDRGAKFIEYETAGIPEYWMIDPLRQEASFFQLGADKRYHLAPLEDDGTYRSKVLPGFWLRVGWLWQRPLPTVAEVSRQIVG